MNILVVYSGFTRRPTLLEGLLAFEKYSAHNISYFNSRLPPFVQGVSKSSTYDLIIFSTLFFSRRTNKEDLLSDFNAVSWLKYFSSVKIATPQDEYINSKYVNEFIDKFNVKLVFSVQPENVWEKVYPRALERGIEIKPILTGYIDDDLVDRFSQNNNRVCSKRQIDIGYRTTGVPPAWYGRHAMLKAQIAESFQCASVGKDLKTDISPSSDKTISNASWYDFLLNCRFTIGTEGGTSILDFDGELKRRTEQYCLDHPNASFEEIEINCFPNLDGTFQGYALSPRHLEACLTGTVQILTEGLYSGVLTPWKHYIPVKKDLSNVNDVIALLSDEAMRKNIAANCYKDIVLSEKYRVSFLVNLIINSAGVGFDSKGPYVERSKMSIGKWLAEINKPGGYISTFIDALRVIKKKASYFA